MSVLNGAVTPAIPVFRSPEEELPSEDLRLRHRVLDLRREEMQRNLELRHCLVLAVRNYMDGLGFFEVETPILTKPTPEGARDYLVPSRNHPGDFFALPQSPQLYKQLLMASGLDRYFQIARCFRDEDLRADRQPEFTQIDIEASFIQPEDLFGWIEGLMASMAAVAGREVSPPFPRMAYAEAMESYGTDRPDLRYGLKIQDWTAELGGLDFRVVQGAIEAGGRARGLRLEKGAGLSRREIEGLEALARKAGAPGLLWVKRTEEGGSGPLARFMAEGDYQALQLTPGDLALVAAGPDNITSPALDGVRVPALTALGQEPAEEDAWLWVVDGGRGPPREGPRENQGSGVRPGIQRCGIWFGEHQESPARGPTGHPAAPWPLRRRDRSEVRLPVGGPHARGSAPWRDCSGDGSDCERVHRGPQPAGCDRLSENHGCPGPF